jgi:hypothetical protein
MGDEHHRPVGGGIGVGIEPERVAYFVECERAEFQPVFELGFGILGVGVLVEPGEFQIGR